jgi:hypothetical protein
VSAVAIHTATAFFLKIPCHPLRLLAQVQAVEQV